MPFLSSKRTFVRMGKMRKMTVTGLKIRYTTPSEKNASGSYGGSQMQTQRLAAEETLEEVFTSRCLDLLLKVMIQ